MCNKWKGNKIIDTADAADGKKLQNQQLGMLQAPRSVEIIKELPSKYRAI